MGHVQCRCRRTTVAARSYCAAIADDGDDQRWAGRCAVSRRWNLAIHASEARVFASLSLAGGVPHPSLAQRKGRSPSDGHATWWLLSRLLLDDDAVAVLRRYHEYLL